MIKSFRLSLSSSRRCLSFLCSLIHFLRSSVHLPVEQTHPEIQHTETSNQPLLSSGGHMSHLYDTCTGLVSSLDWADKVSTTLTWYSHLCAKRFCSCSLKSEHSLFVALHRSSAADHPILLIREINHRKAIKPKTDVSRSERKHISVSRDPIVFLQLLGHVGFHFQPHIWAVSSHLNVHLRRRRKIKRSV